MRAHRSLIFSIVLVLAVTVPATATATGKRLIIGGSTSVLPLAQKLASAYHKAYPHIPAPVVQGGQSDVGISGVAAGHLDIGDSSRNPEETDPKGLLFTKIARDGVCVITNKANALSNLSVESVENIFTGQWRDWSEVPGHKITGPIDLFDRDGASGTQDAFQHIFLANETEKVSPSATAESSNGLEQQAIESDKQAVGFVSFAYTPGTNAVGYNGIACTLRNAKSGQYLGVRNFWMVTKKPPSAEAAKFLNWVTSGNKTTKAIINSSWIAVY